jgi:hypothetical protein
MQQASGGMMGDPQQQQQQQGLGRRSSSAGLGGLRDDDEADWGAAQQDSSQQGEALGFKGHESKLAAVCIACKSMTFSCTPSYWVAFTVWAHPLLQPAATLTADALNHYCNTLIPAFSKLLWTTECCLPAQFSFDLHTSTFWTPVAPCPLLHRCCCG